MHNMRARTKDSTLGINNFWRSSHFQSKKNQNLFLFPKYIIWIRETSLEEHSNQNLVRVKHQLEYLLIERTNLFIHINLWYWGCMTAGLNPTWATNFCWNISMSSHKCCDIRVNPSHLVLQLISGQSKNLNIYYK